MSETSAKADLTTAFVAYSVLYACLVLFGGVMGFVKAKSKASLIASTIVSLVLIGVVYLTAKKDAVIGGAVMVCFSLILVRMFFQKYNKSGETEEKLSEPLAAAPGKKFMPFGLLTLLGMGLAVLSLALVIVAY